ncbi:ribosomal protein L29 [Caldisphaera lagunensis DSM 15908]|uniref:Large ribosomal subunit protein uL29 n=2 Tax=Caldisphaera lagunensis TaxID=200415 RepID=L0AAZ6_CALLD|nr:ribosomal protein L29 [Caldisphaera lagunensis DSM 15908]
MGKYRLKMNDLKKMQEEEVKKTLNDINTELTVLRHKASTGSLDNPARIKQLKKNKARILTLLNEKKKANNK